jgi:hypothetical protein
VAIRIKNWKQFQHFKDRRPIWIKLYMKLLDDIEWHELEPLAAKFLVMFWLIAADDEGRLPDDKELAFRLRTTEKVIDSIIPKLTHWLEGDDIRLIQTEHQNDVLEKTREEKKREEKEAFTLPDTIRPEVWKAFEEHRKKLRKPMTNHARDLIIKECDKLGGDPNDLLDQSIRKGWQDVFPLKEQPNVAPSPSAPMTEPKPYAPPKMCHCGKPATTTIGGEPECDECIQGSSNPAPIRRRAAAAHGNP